MATLKKDLMTPDLKQRVKQLTTLAREAYTVWLQNTAKKTGNARRSTRLKGDVIEANYAYAERLDQGWSKQTPKGMSKPTEEFIRKRTQKILRKR